MRSVTAEELVKRFGLTPHVEGGAFLELDEPVKEGRAASGVIYYALDRGETSDFHVLDSDEYWLWHAGGTLEIWMISPDGALEIRNLGIREGAEPCVLVKAGVIFGARHAADDEECTFLSCVTVPRFSYETYRILSREEAEETCAEVSAFFEE